MNNSVAATDAPAFAAPAASTVPTAVTAAAAATATASTAFTAAAVILRLLPLLDFKLTLSDKGHTCHMQQNPKENRQSRHPPNAPNPNRKPHQSQFPEL